eukprot:92373-Pyramimonas_sp.AAC.1
MFSLRLTTLSFRAGHCALETACAACFLMCFTGPCSTADYDAGCSRRRPQRRHQRWWLGDNSRGATAADLGVPCKTLGSGCYVM